MEQISPHISAPLLLQKASVDCLVSIIALQSCLPDLAPCAIFLPGAPARVMEQGRRLWRADPFSRGFDPESSVAYSFRRGHPRGAMWAAVCVSESTLSHSFFKSRALVQKRASEELRGYEVRVGFFGGVCVSARGYKLCLFARGWGGGGGETDA